MVMLQKRGLNERWAIRRDELDLEPKLFAKGAGGELYRTKWRGLDCVAKTLGVKGAENKSEKVLFTDYAPYVFDKIRKNFGINIEDYLGSIGISI